MLHYIPFVLFLSTVSSLCTWPCNWQGKSFYNSYYGVTEFPTESTISTAAATFICQQIEGNFILFRIQGTDLYTCFKLSEINGDTYILHQTPAASYPSMPNICDMCTPEGFAATAPGVNPQIAIRRDLVDIGCDIPKTCPAGGGDKCSGHEEDIPGQRCNEIAKSSYYSLGRYFRPKK